MVEYQTAFDAIAAIQEEMTSLGATSNPYSTHTWEACALVSTLTFCVSFRMQAVQAKWTQVQNLLPKRAEQLATEAVTQQSHEKLRVQWAQEAHAVQAWAAVQNDAIQNVISNTDNTKMDDQLVALKAIEVCSEMCWCHE